MGKFFFTIMLTSFTLFLNAKSFDNILVQSDTIKKDTIFEKGFTFNISALTIVDFSKNKDEQYGVGFYRNLKRGIFFTSTLTLMIKRPQTVYMERNYENDTFSVQKINYFNNSNFFTFQGGINVFNPNLKFTIYTGIDFFYAFYKDVKTTNEKHTISPANSIYPYTVLDEVTIEKSFRKNHVAGVCIKLGMTSKLNDKLRISFGIEPYFGKSYTRSKDLDFTTGTTNFNRTNSIFGFLPSLFNNLSLIIRLN